MHLNRSFTCMRFILRESITKQSRNLVNSWQRGPQRDPLPCILWLARAVEDQILYLGIYSILYILRYNLKYK